MNKVIFFVDHMALRYLVNKPDLSGRLARWILLLTEFDYTVQYKPGKTHLQADHLSRLSEEIGTEEIDDKFPDGRLFTRQRVPLWYSYIAEFLSTQTFPPGLDRNERRKIRVNSTTPSLPINYIDKALTGFFADVWITPRFQPFWRHATTVRVEDTSQEDSLARRFSVRDIIGPHSLQIQRPMPKCVTRVKGMHEMTSTWIYLSIQLYPFLL